MRQWQRAEQAAHQPDQMINLLWFSIYLWALACGLVDSTTAVDETEFFYLLEEPIQEFRPKPRRDGHNREAHLVVR